MITTQYYWSLTLIVLVIWVIINLSQNMMMTERNLYLVIWKETGGVAIKEFVELKSKMNSFLVEDSSKHEKATGVKIVETIKHTEYKDVLLN